MKYFLLSLLFFIAIATSDAHAESVVDSLLVQELEQMVVWDQLVATNPRPPADYSNLSQNEWESKKDSIYQNHQSRLSDIVNEYGYPGYDLVGKRGSELFFLMIQHSDFNVEFQKRMLDSLKVQLDRNNATASNYALLTDRVNSNMGKKQVYGSQVSYSFFTGKAKPLPTIDPNQLNERRKAIGLGPIEDYLNEMTEMNDQFTPKVFGITIPGLITIFSMLILFGVLLVLIKKKL